MMLAQAEERNLELVRVGSGDGLPVLLLHEGLGSVALWRDFPSRLAETTGREVIVWSRQGYGQSRPFAAPYDLDFMHREADHAVELLDRLGLDRAHFFGHSDGASIALLAAARHPGRVASLVLESPHVFVEDVCIRAIVDFGRTIGQTDVLQRMARYHRDPEAVFHQWHAIWTDPRFPRWSIEKELGGIDAPTLLIQGEDDEYGTFEQLDRVEAKIPGARQLRLSQCRHSPHRDQEDAVLAASVKFLEELA